METAVALSSSMATKTFGGLVAVDGLDMEVKAGTIHSLIGPNGSGKSTFLNMANRIYEINKGRIDIKGTNVNHKSSHQVAELGVSRTFQNIRLFYELPVLDNVMIGGHYKGRTSVFDVLARTRALREEERAFRRKAESCLDFVGLRTDGARLAKHLSYGQQRLLEIARALASSPTLLLLDEPAAGMNLKEKEQLVLLIRRIRSELGMTILLVEHSMNVVMNISDKITVINFGRKIAEGTADEVQHDDGVIRAYLGKRWGKNA